jgi:hypothetical protein
VVSRGSWATPGARTSAAATISASSAGRTGASVCGVFESLDFVYVPTDDVDATAR